MSTKERVSVIPHTNVQELRYNIPSSLRNAAGLLKGRGVDPLGYQQRMRRGWTQRLKKQTKKSVL